MAEERVVRQAPAIVMMDAGDTIGGTCQWINGDLVDLRVLGRLIERLRREAIGGPRLIPYEDHHVYEYEERSVKVVAILKLVRATHGVAAMSALLAQGLLIDFGAAARGVYDAVAEVYFLFEKYPETSANVDQFVDSFFETTIREYLEQRVPPVPTKKIRAAATRAVLGVHDEVYRAPMDRVFQTFSGYVHANYAHVMEVYFEPEDSFNLLGVPHLEPSLLRAEHIDQAGIAVSHAAWFVARSLRLDATRNAIFAFAEENTA